VSESALTSRVKAARKAVGDSGREQRVIRTVHGRGYEFLAPVRAVDGHERTPSGSATLPLRGAAPGTGWLQAAPAPAAAPALPGRRAELERLAGLLGLAAAGQPQAVFVTGEAGIGKTTLVEAFTGWAEGDGRATVARGQCLEHRGAPEPYLPIFDALTRLGRQDGGRVVELLGRVAPTWLVQMPACWDPTTGRRWNGGPWAAPASGCCARSPRPWRPSGPSGRSCCTRRTCTGPTRPPST
jgi:AAA ATPase domain